MVYISMKSLKVNTNHESNSNTTKNLVSFNLQNDKLNVKNAKRPNKEISRVQQQLMHFCCCILQEIIIEIKYFKFLSQLR